MNSVYSKHIFVIFIISLFSTLVYCQDFKPAGRKGHTATLVDDKTIYFFGGRDDAGFAEDFFLWELDQVDGNPPAPKFIDLNTIDNNDQVPKRAFAGAIASTDNQKLYVYGGEGADPTNDLYEFDLSTKSYAKFRSLQEVTLKPPVRQNFANVADDGKFYIWGGKGNDQVKGDNRLYMLDTKAKELAWDKSPQPGVDGAPYDASGTFVGGNLLGDDRIVFFGGKTGDVFVEPTMVQIYNIGKSEWSTQTITGKNAGDSPLSRAGHSAVLGPDDSIYIYGGYSQSPIPREKALMILDTKKWEYVHFSGDSSPAEIQIYHTATIYKDLMIISFGAFGGNNDQPIIEVGGDSNLKPTINFFDLKNNKWLTGLTIEGGNPNVKSTGYKSTTSKTLAFTSIVLSLVFLSLV